MSTRSSISIETSKGKGKTIYAHWDGYPAHNGRILKQHYNTVAKVKKLIALGSVSILGDTIGKKVNFDGFSSKDFTPSQCLAYGRDRGESGQEATNFKGLPTDLQEYNYLFKNGEWLVSHNEGKFTPLTDEMIKERV